MWPPKSKAVTIWGITPRSRYIFTFFERSKIGSSAARYPSLVPIGAKAIRVSSRYLALAPKEAIKGMFLCQYKIQNSSFKKLPLFYIAL